MYIDNRMSSEKVPQMASEDNATITSNDTKMPELNKHNKYYYKHREDILARRKERQLANPKYQAKQKAKQEAKEKKEEEKIQQLYLKLQIKKVEQEKALEQRKIEAKERARQRAEERARLLGIQKASGQTEK